MKVFLIVLLFVSLMQVEVRSASRCGKRGLKVKYGQEKAFTSPTLRKGRCRYKIRAPRGLSVQLTLNEFDVKPCCLNVSIYDAAVPLFKWARAKELWMPAGRPQPAGTEVVFVTSAIGLQLDAARGNSPISFTYEAVIPPIGSFGYDVPATKKRQTLRSPGYPKIKLPSGVSSEWSILSKGPFAISLAFRGLIMASDTDYIEVYDGDSLLQRHSGKMNRKSPIKHLAFSGSMKVYLHTETANSKGFKAVFELIGNASMPVIPTEIAGGLRCHKRNRIMSQGSTISDQQSKITCTGDQICARMVIEGQTSALGTPRTMMSETLSCMPRQVCISNICDAMPSPPDLTVTSCQASCCSTDMCNRSPDGPNVPSPSPTGGDLRCHKKSEFVQEGAIALGSPPENNYCSEDEVCALYVYHGILRNTYTGAEDPIAGQYAGCAARSHCNKDGCATLPDARKAEISSCIAKCCDTNMCNTPGEMPMPSPMPGNASMPVIPTEIAGGLRCHQRNRIMSQGSTISDQQSEITCTGDQICARMVIEGQMSALGTPQTMMSETLSCMPRQVCSSNLCDSMPPSPDLTVTSCQASCCSTDMCNRSPDGPNVPSPSPTASGIRCYQIMEMRGLGRLLPGSQKSLRECDAGWQCMRVRASAVYESFPSAEISIVYGTCVPACVAEGACDSIPSATAGVTIKSCGVTCCQTDFCNLTP